MILPNHHLCVIAETQLRLAVWSLGLVGGLLLVLGMVGCKVSAAMDVWHFYTLLPLGPLLRNVPTLARMCGALAALGGAAMVLPLLLSFGVVHGGLAGVRPVLQKLPAAVRHDVSAPLIGGLLLLAFVGSLAALGMAAVARRRGATAKARLAAYPFRCLATPEAWAWFKLFQIVRSVLGHLTGCVALLLTMLVPFLF